MAIASGYARPAARLFLAVAAGLAVAASSRQRPDTAKQGNASDDHAISVILVPRREATLFAEVAGRVVKIHKELGDTFKPREPLLELDAAMFRAREKKANTDLETARVELAAVEKLYRARSRSLVELMRARRNLARAEMNLAIASNNLAACTIRAPYAGRLAQNLVHEHEWVEQGQKLLRVVDDHVLRARFFVPARLLPRVKLGAIVSIRLLHSGKLVTGRITHKSAVIDAASDTIEVYAQVDNAGGTLNAGMLGRLPSAAFEKEQDPAVK